jgi:hypothetical protein
MIMAAKLGLHYWDLMSHEPAVVMCEISWGIQKGAGGRWMKVGCKTILIMFGLVMGSQTVKCLLSLHIVLFFSFSSSSFLKA